MGVSYPVHLIAHYLGICLSQEILRHYRQTYDELVLSASTSNETMPDMSLPSKARVSVNIDIFNITI